MTDTVKIIPSGIVWCDYLGCWMPIETSHPLNVAAVDVLKAAQYEWSRNVVVDTSGWPLTVDAWGNR